ncbi:DUF4240 domain-containing protein [Paenibacillus xanthanilyticus]|uniref:DUF4240 domain-containing protein n=1 Tax=Paenibacillus xanthanilyticus TaxID=1783531 RepID=A0ABV8K8Z9_9BACL
MTKVFWELIQQSVAHGEEQVTWLTRELSKLSAEDILAFDIQWKQKMGQAYTSSLWGAAYVLMGGCSDDGFEYFRAWLISRGEEVFHKVLDNPEFLAELLSDDYLQTDAFAPQLEEMLSVAADAYTFLKTGGFAYNDKVNDEFLNELEARGCTFEPLHIEFDWEEEELPDKYPLLWERFGENPLT